MSLTFSDTQSRMDRMYRHQGRIYDITRRYYLLGRNQLLDDLTPPAGGTVLEVGCGTAYNLVEAARRYPDAHLHGFDISTEMLASARKSIARQHLAHSISLDLRSDFHIVHALNDPELARCPGADGAPARTKWQDPRH